MVGKMVLAAMVILVLVGTSTVAADTVLFTSTSVQDVPTDVAEEKLAVNDVEKVEVTESEEQQVEDDEADAGEEFAVDGVGEVTVEVTGDEGPTNPHAGLHYIEASWFNFFVVSGTAVANEDARLIKVANNTCECRMMCIMLPFCVAWSTVPLQERKVECRMADEGPEAFDLPLQDNATYSYREESVAGSYFVGEDQLVYLRPNVTLPYDQARDHCLKIPGHRLAIFKTLTQWEFFRDLYYPNETILWTLDLVKNSDGVAVWGDRTRYLDTPLSQHLKLTDEGEGDDIYVLYDHGLITGGRDTPRRFLCQANPLGVVDW